jgi:hypothetical protein
MFSMFSYNIDAALSAGCKVTFYRNPTTEHGKTSCTRMSVELHGFTVEHHFLGQSPPDEAMVSVIPRMVVELKSRST